MARTQPAPCRRRYLASHSLALTLLSSCLRAQGGVLHADQGHDEAPVVVGREGARAGEAAQDASASQAPRAQGQHQPINPPPTPVDHNESPHDLTSPLLGYRGGCSGPRRSSTTSSRARPSTWSSARSPTCRCEPGLSKESTSVASQPPVSCLTSPSDGVTLPAAVQGVREGPSPARAAHAQGQERALPLPEGQRQARQAVSSHWP